MPGNLNHYFVSVWQNLAKWLGAKNEDYCLKHITQVRDQMEFKAIDESYALNANSQWEEGMVSGPDKVSVRFMKDAARFISYPLM